MQLAAIAERIGNDYRYNRVEKRNRDQLRT